MLIVAFCLVGAILIALVFVIRVPTPAQGSASDVPPGTGASSTPEKNVPTPAEHEYIEITDSCGPYYEGICVNMRSGPGTAYPVVMQLRNGMVLKVAGTKTGQDGRTWYKIGFEGEIHYPELVTSDWYVVADYVRLFSDVGESNVVNKIDASSTKRIVIDLAKEVLYAYDGDTLFMQQAISTGLELTPTPKGTF